VNSEAARVPIGVGRSKTARVLFSRLYDRRQEIIRWLTLVGASLAIVTTALLIFSAILHSPVAAFLSVAAGAAVRALGQTLNLKQLRRSDKPAELATFEFHDGKILCHVDEAGVLRYTSAWTRRIFAALMAAGACLAVQHLPVPEFNLLPEFFRKLRWFYPLVEGCAAALSVFSAILFLQVKWPERRWAGEARAAIDARVTASSHRLLQSRELDGLAAGVEALWQALGVERRGEYRTAVAKYLGNDTAAAVLRPETAESVLDAMTELARQDLIDLSAALEAYREAERHWEAVHILAAATRQPSHEVKAEELGAELDHLSRLASERQWEELQRRAAWLGSELDALQASLRLHSSSVPPVILASGNDPYRVLGVSVDTPTALIRKLRLSLAQLYHPDISHSTRNSVKMAELNAAYDAVMKDREREAR
jgi:DnaJ domain